MRNGCLASVAALLAGAGLATAQVPYPPPAYYGMPYPPAYGYGMPMPPAYPFPPAVMRPAPHVVPAYPVSRPTAAPVVVAPPTAPVVETTAPVEEIVTAPEPGAPIFGRHNELKPEPTKAPHWWGGVDYLYWRLKDAPVPGPVVTTGDPADVRPGAIGQPGTRVLFGSEDFDLDWRSGIRGTVGFWCDCDARNGFEVSGFLLGRSTTNFTTTSGPAGTPTVFLPFFNPVTGLEDAVVVASPARSFTGSVQATASADLWGAEANLLRNLKRCDGCVVDLLYGFRYLSLEEDLGLANLTTDLLTGERTALFDNFETRNQFYGGQLGMRFAFRHGPLGLDLTGKVGVGANHQEVNVDGRLVRLAANPIVSAGGFLAQPTNTGSQARDQFAVLPEVGVKASWCFHPCVRAVVGYDFLYWNNVVRPGSQDDRGLNLSQSPEFGGNALVGPARPARLFNTTDFYAHGVSVGLHFQY